LSATLVIQFSFLFTSVVLLVYMAYFLNVYKQQAEERSRNYKEAGNIKKMVTTFCDERKKK